jgi:hypothetical protein
MTGQTRKTVLVGGTARLVLAPGKRVSRATQLHEQHARRGRKPGGHGDNPRHQPVHGLRHAVVRPIGEEADNTSLRVGDRLGLAAIAAWRRSKFQILQSASALDHAHKARIDFAAGTEQCVEFRNGVAKGRALHQCLPRVAPPRQLVADTGHREA